MLFNSFQFLVFIAIVIPAYFLLPQKFRWVFLLAASYYFYMSWNIKYVLLILFTTFISYICAIGLERAKCSFRGGLEVNFSHFHTMADGI